MKITRYQECQKHNVKKYEGMEDILPCFIYNQERDREKWKKKDRIRKKGESKTGNWLMLN